MKEKGKKQRMLAEFRTFALRGNVIDLAVGVIIGGAFGKITTSLVGDIIMPFIGLFLGGVDFTSLNFSLGPIFPSNEPSIINIGNFIQTVVDFLIIALVIFFMIKIMNGLRRKEEKAEPCEPEAPPAPSKSELLLEEIRDLLAKSK